MNKKFDVIPIDDYGVVIDIVEKMAANTLVYSSGGNHLEYFRERWQEKDFPKVIATINKRIDDVPLIELPDEVREKLYNIIANDWANHEDDYPAINSTVDDCYRLITQKKYSEEDMRDAIHNARIKLPSTKSAYIYQSDNSGDFKLTPDEIIKSLQPKLPKSVVLEIDGIKEVENYYRDGMISNSDFGKPIITNPSTNTIIPISYD